MLLQFLLDEINLLISSFFFDKITEWPLWVSGCMLNFHLHYFMMRNQCWGLCYATGYIILFLALSFTLVLFEIQSDIQVESVLTVILIKQF